VPERSDADWSECPASRSSTEGFSGQLAIREATTQPDAPAETVSDAFAGLEQDAIVQLTTHYNEVKIVFHHNH
jgi:hypothetical protein